MHCKTVQKHLVAYTDAELSEPVRLAVENHLSACGQCRHALLVLEASRPGPGTPQEHPPEFWAPMHQAVLKELEKPVESKHSLVWTVLYAASLVLAIFWLFQGTKAPKNANIGTNTSTQTSAFSLPP